MLSFSRFTPRNFIIREYTSGNCRQNGSKGYRAQTALNIPVCLFSRSLKIGVNFAFVLTPK